MSVIKRAEFRGKGFPRDILCTSNVIAVILTLQILSCTSPQRSAFSGFGLQLKLYGNNIFCGHTSTGTHRLLFLISCFLCFGLLAPLRLSFLLFCQKLLVWVTGGGGKFCPPSLHLKDQYNIFIKTKVYYGSITANNLVQ